MKALTATVAAATALADPAASQAPPDCIPDWHPRLVAERPIDLGNGLVAQWQSRTGPVTGEEGVWAESGAVVHDCAAGAIVYLWTSRHERDGSTTYDKRREARAMLREAARNHRLKSLEQLLELAGEDRIDRRKFGPVGIETCPCLAIYPDLQGDKVSYEDVQ